jgi:hypothetical protein
MRSSPPSSIRASQYSAASGSDDRTLLCSAEIRLCDHYGRGVPDLSQHYLQSIRRLARHKGDLGGLFAASLVIPAYENKDGTPTAYADFTMLHEIMHVLGATDAQVAAGLGLTYDPKNTEPSNSALMQRCGYSI